MSFILLPLLLLLLVESTTITLQRGTPTFTLDARKTNPTITELERNNIPYATHWEVFSSPYDVSNEKHDFGIVAIEKFNVIDAKDLVQGDYVFQLYTSEFKDLKTTISFYNVSIRDLTPPKKEDVKQERQNKKILAVLESFGDIFDGIIVLQYIAIKFAHDVVRVIIVSFQYMRDQAMSFEEATSPRRLMRLKYMDIDTSHYADSSAHYPLEYYFTTNKVPYYEQTKNLFTFLYEMTGLQLWNLNKM